LAAFHAGGARLLALAAQRPRCGAAPGALVREHHGAAPRRDRTCLRGGPFGRNPAAFGETDPARAAERCGTPRRAAAARRRGGALRAPARTAVVLGKHAAAAALDAAR